MATAGSDGLQDLLAAFDTVMRDHQPDLDAAALADDASRQADEIMAAPPFPVDDEAGLALLQRSSLELALYSVLRTHLEDSTAYDLMHQIVVEPRRATVKNWLSHRMQVDTEAPEQAFEQIKKNFRSGGARVFGSYFHYADDKVDDDHNHVSIRRCFFNDFFRRMGAPELTKLHCATDMIWAEELNNGPYNARFERPTKMSDGDDMCRFNFHRDEAAD